MRYSLRFTFYLSVLIVCGLAAHAQEQKSSPSPQPSPAPAVTESTPPNWQEFSSAEGGFKVLLPGIPRKSTDSVDTAVGPLVMHKHVLETKLGAYFVGYADIPLPSDEPEVIRRVLDGGRNEVLSGGAKLLNETDITLDGIVGRELIVDKHGVIIRARIFVLKGRSYQAVFATIPEVVFKNGEPSANASDRLDSYEATSAKFFNSFKITGPTERVGEVDALLRGAAGKTILGTCDPVDPNCTSVPGKLTLAGRAVSLPEPLYPAIAQQARASGTVVIKIIVDEEGKVIAAQAISGHPLLQAVAVASARQARFSPVLVDGKPVKVVGSLSYNFVPK